MDIKITVLEQVIKWLVGGEAFKMIAYMVGELMDEDKSNDEKREAVKEYVMPYVKEIGKFLLSTAIAFAVDKAKSELAKANQ